MGFLQYAKIYKNLMIQFNENTRTDPTSQDPSNYQQEFKNGYYKFKNKTLTPFTSTKTNTLAISFR